LVKTKPTARTPTAMEPVVRAQSQSPSIQVLAGGALTAKGENLSGRENRALPSDDDRAKSLSECNTLQGVSSSFESETYEKESQRRGIKGRTTERRGPIK